MRGLTLLDGVAAIPAPAGWREDLMLAALLTLVVWAYFSVL